ncbi:hypothetical protein [Flavobacterium sp.]|uniref:hypothetical protein n=1 Tax=Flavobacterium sp. TaxID=239 RepID=UPI0039E5E230
MRKFLINVVLFVVPLLVLVVGIEVYLGNYPSGFQCKAQYLNQHLDKIEILAVGSSHSQDGINPEFFSKHNAANVSFSGQDLRLDQKLLELQVPRLPNLKYVLLELGYHSLDIMHRGDYDKNTLYLRFYGINNFDRRAKLGDYSIFLSSPQFYLGFLNPNHKRLEINEYGFETGLSDDPNHNRFKDMEYNEATIDKDRENILIQRHRERYPEAEKENLVIFEQMVDYCVAHKLQPIINIPPVYQTYYEEMVPDKKKTRDDLIQKLRKKYPQLIVFDYEHIPDFKVTDFYNEDHLNPIGAKKFSLMLDEAIQKL